MTNPNQLSNEPETKEPAIIERASDSPERKGFFRAIRDLGAQALDQAFESAPGLIARAGEMVDSAKDEIVRRTPEVRGQVEKIAGVVADKAIDGYDATVEGTRDVLRRGGELASPVVDIAKDTYVEVVKPIGSDVLTALGKEYGVDYDVERDNKLKIRPIKFGRAVLRAIKNPATALASAASIASNTAKRSSVKMFVT
jgi:hypothetical protein